MMQRDANGLAFVLEDEDVVNEREGVERAEAICPDLYELIDLLDGFSGEC